MTWMSDYLAESHDAMRDFGADTVAHETMTAMAERIVHSLRDGGKLMLAGNGGSAGDAQHIAGEFVARLMFDRAPLAAIALTTDTSAITATGNDYGYDHIFERQVMALGRPGDVFLGISTSGRSPNVLRAFDVARANGVACIGFCGREAREFGERAELLLRAPSLSTPIIQQIHIVAAHVVCALVEQAMFPRG